MDEKQLLENDTHKSWKAMETLTIAPLCHSGHRTEITACQHHSEEDANLGGLMRLCVRSRVQKLPFGFQKDNWKRIGHLE